SSVPVYEAILYVVESSVVVRNIIARMIKATNTTEAKGSDVRISGTTAIGSSVTVLKALILPVNCLSIPRPPSTPVAPHASNMGAKKYVKIISLIVLPQDTLAAKTLWSIAHVAL